MNQSLNDGPGRKSLPHLPPIQFQNQSIIFFVTVCTKDRQPFLNKSAIHKLLCECWIEADSWLVGRYVVMPDHIHLFCAPSTFPPQSVQVWIKYWKSLASRHWPFSREKSIWQKGFFDRQLRHQESYHEKWNYVIENPVRAGLVRNAEDWPYQGELNVLRWSEPA